MSLSPRELWFAAVAAVERGDTADAVSLCRRLVDGHPDFSRTADAAFYLQHGRLPQEELDEVGLEAQGRGISREP